MVVLWQDCKQCNKRLDLVFKMCIYKELVGKIFID